MAKEIERKFLLSDPSILQRIDKKEEILQGYLSVNPDSTVRLRIKGDNAFLTIKSRNAGAVRNEWEYPISVEDARQMFKSCGVSNLISKTRYRFGRWEIDEFHNKLNGLIVAEIELATENEIVDLPAFIGREVTDDVRYYNSFLATASAEDIPLI